MTLSLLNTGLEGLQRSQGQIQQAAEQIVRVGTTEPSGDLATDLVEPIVKLNVETQLFNASAKLVKSADELLGTLLDDTA